jgi:hypothetical protein
MTNSAVDPFLARVDPELLRPPVNLVRLGLDPRGFAPMVVNLASATGPARRPGAGLLLQPGRPARRVLVRGPYAKKA